MEPEQSLTFNKNTHFIFAVSVLPDEFFPDPFQIRCVPIHAYHVHCLIPALYHEGFEFVIVGGEDLLVRVCERQVCACRPSFMDNAACVEKLPERRWLA
jgi:hypothetical protein